MFFSDFILVYEEDTEVVSQKSMEGPKKGPVKKPDKKTMSQKDKQEMWRQKFLNNLKKAGLEMEEVSLFFKKKKINIR